MLAIIFRGTNEPRSVMCVATFICGEIWMLWLWRLLLLSCGCYRCSCCCCFCYLHLRLRSHFALFLHELAQSYMWRMFACVYLRICAYVCVLIRIYCVGKCTNSVPQQLRMQTYLCGYVPLHIFSKFYISPGRQAASKNISLALFASSPTRPLFQVQVSDSSAYGRHLQCAVKVAARHAGCLYDK